MAVQPDIDSDRLKQHRSSLGGNELHWWHKYATQPGRLPVLLLLHCACHTELVAYCFFRTCGFSFIAVYLLPFDLAFALDIKTSQQLCISSRPLLASCSMFFGHESAFCLCLALVSNGVMRPLLFAAVPRILATSLPHNFGSG